MQFFSLIYGYFITSQCQFLCVREHTNRHTHAQTPRYLLSCRDSLHHSWPHRGWPSPLGWPPHAGPQGLDWRGLEGKKRGKDHWPFEYTILLLKMTLLRIKTYELILVGGGSSKSEENWLLVSAAGLIINTQWLQVNHINSSVIKGLD